MVLPVEKKKEAVELLQKKIFDLGKKKGLKCPICGNQGFSFVDGYTSKFLNENTNNIQLGGINVPCFPLVCRNCGFVFEFALGALGLLEQEKKEEKK